jgi:hypothetical protein
MGQVKMTLMLGFSFTTSLWRGGWDVHESYLTSWIGSSMADRPQIGGHTLYSCPQPRALMPGLGSIAQPWPRDRRDGAANVEAPADRLQV